MGQSVTVLGLHFQAGLSADDQACRLEQIAAVDAFFGTLSSDSALWVAGDFNFDVGLEGPEVSAWSDVAARHGLARLPDDGDTSVLLGVDLDAAYVRGRPVPAGCTLHTPDSALEAPMLDHRLLACGVD